MATENFFTIDLWMSEELASPVTEDHPQNYYRLVDASTLSDVLVDYTPCLASSTVLDPINFPGWELCELPKEFGHQWRRVVYAHGMYVAIANKAYETTVGMVATSTDGITWTLRTTPNGLDFQGYYILWVAELSLFVVGGYTDSGEFNAITSPDGVTWTSRVIGDPTYTVEYLAWSPSLGRLVATNSFGAIWEYSSDAITWTHITDYEDYGWTALAWSESLSIFVAVGAYMGFSLSSPDGINWTAHSMLSHNYFELEWSSPLSLFVAFSEKHEDEFPFVTSTNGTTWTEQSLNFTVVSDGTDSFLPCWSLRWDTYSNKFYAVSSGDLGGEGTLTTPSLYLIESSDGVTWNITPDIPGMHDYGYAIDSSSDFRDIAFKSETERVILGKYYSFYYTGV